MLLDHALHFQIVTERNLMEEATSFGKDLLAGCPCGSSEERWRFVWRGGGFIRGDVYMLCRMDGEFLYM